MAGTAKRRTVTAERREVIDIDLDRLSGNLPVPLGTGRALVEVRPLHDLGKNLLFPEPGNPHARRAFVRMVLGMRVFDVPYRVIRKVRDITTLEALVRTLAPELHFRLYAGEHPEYGIPVFQGWVFAMSRDGGLHLIRPFSQELRCIHPDVPMDYEWEDVVRSGSIVSVISFVVPVG